MNRLPVRGGMGIFFILLGGFGGPAIVLGGIAALIGLVSIFYNTVRDATVGNANATEP